MYCRLIGVGAAGNKASITAVENGIINVKHTMLVNSTLKDIPAEYQNKEGAIVRQYVNAYGGCGKERNLSFDLCRDSLMKDTLGLEEFLGIGEETECELCIIVASTEGGTGSGSAPLLAKYIKESLGVPVHVFGIAGFEDDVRGMANTVEFFKEMQNNYTVSCIKNSKFLTECNNNKIKAEKKANEEFCKKISVLMGLQLRDSEHNIDPTDLLKISTEEGYMIIETCVFTEKIKNREQFRQAVIDTLDNSKALDIDTKGMARLGVIMNIKEESADFIDYADIVIDRFGQPYEKFEHIQNEVNSMPEFISFIASGMQMPTDEVEAIYKNYEATVNRVNKSNDPFFSTIHEKQIDASDKKFDLKDKQKSTVSKADFFKNMQSPKEAGFKNTKTKMVSVPDGANSEYE